MKAATSHIVCGAQVHSKRWQLAPGRVLAVARALCCVLWAHCMWVTVRRAMRLVLLWSWHPTMLHSCQYTHAQAAQAMKAHIAMAPTLNSS